MSGISEAARRELEAELAKLRSHEAEIDADLRQYFSELSGEYSSSSAKHDSSDLRSNVKKIEKFSPCFEAMGQDSKKLAAQVEDCRQLSDKMSMIVRRLDIMQIRAQQALACTEDIINLKDCKLRMLTAMEEKNLPLAVSYIKQVHDIDLQAAKASDDFGAIQQTERELRVMVKDEFEKAIESSNISAVMSLCPLLQTLGLETEARDSFLAFVENKVFIGVSADASAVDDATDPSTGYAQALSNVFNASYIILQQYLPMVIQGMENSLGDVYFIRRLHAKCEHEAGLVLKRYMKYRNIKDVVSAIRAGTASTQTKQPTQADMHMLLDELALLIQYCCMYSKYLNQLCVGAESRKRIPTSAVPSLSKATSSAVGVSAVSASPLPSATGAVALMSVTVFPGPTEFDKMVDELINRYYMEGEQWLMRQGLRSALPKAASMGSSTADESGAGLDECFFVLQRCSQRAVATNNIQAASAVLHVVTDLLSSELAGSVAELLTVSVGKMQTIVHEHLSKFIRGSVGDASGGESLELLTGASISKGFQSAMSIATSITGTGGAGGGGAGGGAGGLEDDEVGEGEEDEDDPWGTSQALQAFDIADKCARYTERLGRDISGAGESVFGKSIAADVRAAGGSASAPSSEVEKMKVCREDFDAAKLAFLQALRHGSEKLTAMTHTFMKDILVKTLGRTGPMGGVKFDMADDRFDSQPALALLPKTLVTPFETLVGVCTTTLSESNKDMVVGMLADACCERLEHFISQTNFRFAGALKFEECVRALSAMFTRSSSAPIRGKFSRLREVMLVLTADVASPASIVADSFSHLTTNEILAFVSLRKDATDGSA